MSDLLSKVAEDEADYQRLCQRYGEPIHSRRNGQPDVYGPHHQQLRKRFHDEFLQDDVEVSHLKTGCRVYP